MKTTILFKLAVSSVIGLGVALLAACGGSPVGYEGCLDNMTREECEAIGQESQQGTANMTGEGGGDGIVFASTGPDVRFDVIARS